jgi:hypothetical protein
MALPSHDRRVIESALDDSHGTQSRDPGAQACLLTGRNHVVDVLVGERRFLRQLSDRSGADDPRPQLARAWARTRRLQRDGSWSALRDT